MYKLEMIAAGGVSAVEARSILGELPRELDLVGARKLFVALRAWTWKALDQKRRDGELRDWHDVMKRAQVRAKGFEQVAQQLQVLLDLIHESIAVALRKPAGDVLKRRHAKTVLALLRHAPVGSLSKAELMEHLGVKHANLTRLMNVLTGAGLVERISDGREAHYRLSRLGFEHAPDTTVHVFHGVDAHWTAFHHVHNRAGLVDERAQEIQAEMLLGLKRKLLAKGGGRWLASFDRENFGVVTDPSSCVRKVGSAYYREQQNLFGDPTRIGKMMVVDRSEPPAFALPSMPRTASLIDG